uniref:Chloramphenicol acetyltransferase n=1 Tax=Candidatus Kentrum sp. DK TaxID=2126562 RepID=A0A450RXX8_9GAMM|nr:MAG: galactoside O-acetyltransferase [Candidatus Kentron sp. DK]
MSTNQISKRTEGGFHQASSMRPWPNESQDIEEIAPRTSFYSEEELQRIGFARLGKNVLISRKASIYAPDNIEIGSNSRIDDFVVLSGGVGIKIGRNVHIACHALLFGGAGIIMEDFSGLSGHASIYSESDDYSGHSLTNATIPGRFKPKYCRGPVTISRHVIVGANSTILPSVTLHEGVAVGANSLITKDCKPWRIYFGNPARKLKTRSRALLELEEKFHSEKEE